MVEAREELDWSLYGKAVRELAHMVADGGFQPDIILAIARGGLFVAGSLGYALSVKNLYVMNVEYYTGVDERLDVPVMLPPYVDFIDLHDSNVLIADDVADTGHTLDLVRRHCEGKVGRVASAVLYQKSHSVVDCEYVWRHTDKWINFPWSTEPPVVEIGQGQTTAVDAVSLSTDTLGRLDAIALAELVRSGEASPLELVDAAIARIEALDPGINAVIHPTFDKAREAAQSPDLPDGPFKGVPFLLKDLWPTSAGDPFHMGIAGFKKDGYIHPSDSNLVTAYRRAGFIILGRTNTPEMGLTATTEPVAYGPTRNPWDTNRGTGGSSGGAAAAVAAGMVPAANASDGGGSIRIPAAMCGLVGLKPSRGRLSMGPLREEWGLSVQHVVSHTVRDSAAILDATAHPFPGDGVVAPDHGRPYAQRTGKGIGPLRIGILLETRGVDTHPDCAATAERAGAFLEGLGHAVEPAGPEALDREDFRAAFTTLWAVGAATDIIGVGQILGRELGPDDVEPGTWEMVERGRDVHGVDLAGAQAASGSFRRAMASWWADGWDLLLTPTTLSPQPEIGELTATAEEPLRAAIASIPYAALTSPFNITGQPAISLPVGHSSDGLPLGAQLVAAYGREDLLFDVASQLETEVDWASRRAPLHP